MGDCVSPDKYSSGDSEVPCFTQEQCSKCNKDGRMVVKPVSFENNNLYYYYWYCSSCGRSWVSPGSAMDISNDMSYSISSSSYSII